MKAGEKRHIISKGSEVKKLLLNILGARTARCGLRKTGNLWQRNGMHSFISRV